MPNLVLKQLVFEKIGCVLDRQTLGYLKTVPIFLQRCRSKKSKEQHINSYKNHSQFNLTLRKKMNRKIICINAL